MSDRPTMLLTGCTGWLGRSITPFFQQRFDCDVLSRKPGTNLSGDAKTIKLEHKYDYIIHGALEGARNIAAQAHGAKMVYLSSGAAYDQNTSYAMVKRMDESVVRDKAVIARLFSFVGKDMPTHYAVGAFLDAAKNGGPIVVRSPYTVRSYMHVDELPEVLEACFDIPDGEIVDVGSPVKITMLSLAKIIAKQAGVRVVQSRVWTTQTEYVPRYAATPRVGIDEAVRLSL